MATLSGVFRCFCVSGISLALLPRQNGPSTAQEPRKVRKEGGVTGGLALLHSPPWNSGATAGHCGVKAVILHQGNPTQEGKMGLFGAPLHHFGANLTQAGKDDVDGAEVVHHLQLWEHQAGDSLCKRVSCAVLVAPKVCWRV